MHALTLEQLTTVVGGRTLTEGSDGSVTYSQTPYETCQDTIRQSAYEKYPDSRWFFQKWVGAKDGNADARADFLKTAIPTACGMPK